MQKRVSPIFIVAGVVVGLSCFVLLSMLFYSPSDYFENAREVAASKGGGFRFSVAATFFQPFGVAAYLGWAIILLWAVIVFFKEAVGELALRAVSLVVVVVTGAAVAHLLGSQHLGGHLGNTVGTALASLTGDTFGVVLLGSFFAVSFLLATDFGFLTYLREAKTALAEPEEEEVPDENDLVKIIERTAREVEEESEAAQAAREPEPEPEAEPEVELLVTEPPVEEPVVEKAPEPMLPAEVIRRGEDRPVLMMNTRPMIEEETLDEDLLVEGESAAAEPRTVIRENGSRAVAVETEPEEPSAGDALSIATAELEAALAEREADAATAPAVEVDVEEVARALVEAQTLDPPVPAKARDTMRDLDSVFDALVGLAHPHPEPAAEALAAPEPEPEPAMAEAAWAAPAFVLDDVLVFGGPAPEPEPAPVAEPEPAPAPEPEPVAEAEPEPPAHGGFILLDDVIPVAAAPGAEEAPPEAAPPAEVPEAAAEPEPAPGIPVLEDVEEEPEEPKAGLFRSLFARRKPKETPVERDPLLSPAANLVLERGRASVVLLQRRLDIGYTRASRLVEAMEREGLVGPLEESGSREVRMTAEEWERHLGTTDPA